SLPLGFRRQRLSSPRRIGRDVLVGYLYDRMVPEPLQGASRSPRVPPVGAAHVRPPVVRVAQVDRTRGLAEDHGRGFEQLRLRGWIVGPIGGAPGGRHVTSCL